MSIVCPKCGHGFETAKAPQTAPDFEKTRVLLSMHPKAETTWKKFLNDIVNQQFPLSDKQWKFFKVIHFNCLGTWPEDDTRPRVKAPSEMKASEPDGMPDHSMDTIPF